MVMVMSEKEESQSPLNNEQTDAARVMRTLGIYALLRTAFSSERSMLSWMRTSVSLYTFGFSIIKFLDYLEQQEGTEFPAGPRWLGFILICMGILVLVLAATEHLRRLRKMKELGLPRISLFSLPFGATVAILMIGFAVLISIGLNWSA